MWEYPTDDGPHDFYMDPGKEVRFRVTSDVFVDTSPTGPADAAVGTGDDLVGGGGRGGQDQQDAEKKIPYLIYGSVNEPGLGLLEWWQNS